MKDKHIAAPSDTAHPLTDEYVNAVIQHNGYGSSQAVIARLYQWMGRHGGENSASLLIYEAYKALSKLNRPVADERAAFEAWNSMHGQYRRSDAYQRLDNGNYVEWPVEHGWRVWQARAALASAPVAGDGKTRVPGDQLGGPAVAWDDGAQSDPNRPESRASIESKGGALAPVAGEAQPVCWIEKVELESVRDEGGDAWVYWCPAGHVAEHDEMPLYAAPQASEAVRDAAFEAVRKRLCAIPRFSFYLDDDGVVRRVEGRSGNWIEFDTVHALFDPVSVDAALSAQPGAQKEQHTDGGAVYG